MENVDTPKTSMVLEGRIAPQKTGKKAAIKIFLKNHWKLLTGVSVAIIIVILVIVLPVMLTKGNGTGTGTSSFVVPPKKLLGAKQEGWMDGDRPFMQDGCAGGSSCTVNNNTGNSLGFGYSSFADKASADEQRRVAEELLKKQSSGFVSNFKENNIINKLTPFGKKSHMEPKREHMTDEEAKAQAEAIKAYEIARATSSLGARQNSLLSTCSSAWDPMAVEEAKVLSSVGVYKSATPGMASFTRTVNGETANALTDAQLELILQGGEPFTTEHATITPASMQDVQRIQAEARKSGMFDPRSQVANTPPKAFA